MSTTDICNHETIEDGICILCGLTISESSIDNDSEFSKHHQRTRYTSGINFDKDLEKLDLDRSIKSWVLEKISASPKSIYRMGTRSKVLYAYIYLAHLHLGYTFKPNKIAKLLEIDRAGIDESLKIVSGISSHKLANDSFSVPVVVISPVNEVLSLCQEIEISNELSEEIVTFSKKIISQNPILLEDDPRKIAIGIIRYVFETKSIPFVGYSKKMNVSSSIIKKYRDLIFKLIN